MWVWALVRARVGLFGFWGWSTPFLQVGFLAVVGVHGQSGNTVPIAKAPYQTIEMSMIEIPIEALRDPPCVLGFDV